MKAKIDTYKLTYRVHKDEKYLCLFYKNYVKKMNKRFKIIINNKVSPLIEEIPTKDIKQKHFTIKLLCFRKISFEVKIFNCCKSIHKISTKRNYNNTLYSYPNIHILKRKDNPSLNETVKEKAYQALKEMDNNYDSKIKEASGNELLLSSIGDISDKYTMIYKISKDKNMYKF